MYNTKGLVNVKNLVLKNPEQRSVKEVVFLILYLKFKFPVFFEIDKRTLEYFVKRLSFALYKPGELLAIKGEVCQSMIMIIDGEVDAMELDMPGLRRASTIDFHNEVQELKSREKGYIKTFTAGTSFGE